MTPTSISPSRQTLEFDDLDMERIGAQAIGDAAITVDNRDAQLLFISCTRLPAIGVVAEIERPTGKPVVTSNQASDWAMAGHVCFADHAPFHYGRLLECPLPAYDTGKAA